MAYDWRAVEARIQERWEQEKPYATHLQSDKEKLYLLVEFPYPSGAGLHVGHVRSYTAMDVIARKRRAEGMEVLFPMGWDAFGLPAENYAIKTGIHPSVTTRENIETFRRQLKSCGFSFDWTREVDTTDPKFYKWSQWIFLKLYEKGLAYKKLMPVNWCPKDKCVLANEEVIEGKCERCGTEATKKDKEQWMLAITKYAERLDKDLDETDYLEKIKIQQRNWIGLSQGAEIDFKLRARNDADTTQNVAEGYTFTVFTTRADTLYGATYCVLAPEHPLVEKLITEKMIENIDEVILYRDEAKAKLDIDRSAEGREKTGVRLEGVIAVNPVNGEELPVFIADYVLPQYGTGAIMAVPAHDERDYEFAKKYNLPIKEVIRPYVIDHVNTPRTDKPTKIRNNVHAIVYDPKQKKYLIIRNSIHKWDTVIIGGIEEGEDAVAAAKRELIEETGYSDVVFKKILGEPVQAGYFAPHKDENRLAISTAVYFELGSDARVSIEKDGENEGNEVLWISKEDFVPGKMINSELSHWLARIDGKYVTSEDGVLVNSNTYSGMNSEEARKKITEAVGGRIVTKSKLRDWVFARQRYWGEPIPIVYDKSGTMYPVAESELPIMLPQVAKYEPTDNGESPLYQVPDWVNIKGRIDDTGHFVSDANGEVFRRETDTMPQWAGSSWYFMRYIDPHNTSAVGDTKLLEKWLPVDWYNGGMEHTTLHLLYSRFWYKFLFDIGVVKNSEPYTKRTSQGMILGAGGVKMSKSLGNIVNPDDIIKNFGADVLRVYELFIGPFDQAVAWDDKAIVGVRRFLDRVEMLSHNLRKDGVVSPSLHRTIKAVTEDIESMKFNTAIASLMTWLNDNEKRAVSEDEFTIFLQLLTPFAPHLGSHLYSQIKHHDVDSVPWPKYDETQLLDSLVTVALQVNGKLRGTFEIARDSSDEDVVSTAQNTDMYKKYVDKETPKKVVVIKNKLVSVVV